MFRVLPTSPQPSPPQWGGEGAIASAPNSSLSALQGGEGRGEVGRAAGATQQMTPADLRGFLATMVENWGGPAWDAARLGFHERLTPALQPAPGFGYRRLHLCARQLYVLSRAPALLGAAVPMGMTETVFRVLAERFPRRAAGRLLPDPGSRRRAARPAQGSLRPRFRSVRPRSLSRDLGRSGRPTLGTANLRRDPAPSRSARADGSRLRRRRIGARPTQRSRRTRICICSKLVWPWKQSMPIRAGATRPMRWSHCFTDISTIRRAGCSANSTMKPANRILRPGNGSNPGHQFEWAWLLHAHAARRSIEAPVAADALIEQATRMGIDPDGGGLWDRIDRAGGVVGRNQADLAGLRDDQGPCASLAPARRRRRSCRNDLLAGVPEPALSARRRALARDLEPRLVAPAERHARHDPLSSADDGRGSAAGACSFSPVTPSAPAPRANFPAPAGAAAR